jgi:hypothetical protein
MASSAPKPAVGSARSAGAARPERVTAPLVEMLSFEPAAPIRAWASRLTGMGAGPLTVSEPLPCATMSPAACMSSAEKPLMVMLPEPSVIWPGAPAGLEPAINRKPPVPLGTVAKTASEPLEFVTVMLPASSTLSPAP